MQSCELIQELKNKCNNNREIAAQTSAPCLEMLHRTVYMKAVTSPPICRGGSHKRNSPRN